MGTERERDRQRRRWMTYQGKEERGRIGCKQIKEEIEEASEEKMKRG